MAATVDQKLLRQTKFPLEFNKKVDMKKVNVEVMKKCVCLNTLPLFHKLTESCPVAGG